MKQQPLPLFKKGEVVFSQDRDDHGHIEGFSRNIVGELCVLVKWSKEDLAVRMHPANIRVYQ